MRTSAKHSGRLYPGPPVGRGASLKTRGPTCMSHDMSRSRLNWPSSEAESKPATCSNLKWSRSETRSQPPRSRREPFCRRASLQRIHASRPQSSFVYRTVSTTTTVAITPLSGRSSTAAPSAATSSHCSVELAVFRFGGHGCDSCRSIGDLRSEYSLQQRVVVEPAHIKKIARAPEGRNRKGTEQPSRATRLAVSLTRRHKIVFSCFLTAGHKALWADFDLRDN